MTVEQDARAAATPVLKSAAETTAFSILAALSLSHLLNDLIQSLLPAVYPILKTTFRLSYAQIGLITLSYQLTASLLQPLVGSYTDRRPLPYSLVFGMALSFAGLIMVAFAPTFATLLAAAAVVGMGSSIFHPEASRMARLASGGRHGLAQSIFQVGGNAGSSLGPLLAAFVVVRNGQHALSWFGILALFGMAILWRVALYYRSHPVHRSTTASITATAQANGLSASRVAVSLAILLTLVFSKYFYLTSITSYYTFYLIHKFNVSIQSSEFHLFAFLAAVALGTIVGGPVGDRIGRKYVIWVSILGVLPFTLLLPYASLFWTGVLSLIIGFILASAFSAIIVFAQEILPGRVGMVSGLFFGFAFGMAGIGAAVLGAGVDHVGIERIYRICSYLPAIGLLTVFLPRLNRSGALPPRPPNAA